MARFHTASNDADARLFPAASNVDADPGLDFVRVPNLVETVEGADGPPEYPFRTRGTARVSTFAQSFTIRPWDQNEAERFVGSHGVIARTPIGPAGQQVAWDAPNRVVFRPVPQAWDAGYVRGA